MKRAAWVLSWFFLAGAVFGQTADEKRSAAEAKEAAFLRRPGVLSLKAVQDCVTSDISYGQTVNGALTVDDCRLSSDNSYVDFWQFQGVAGQSVAIDMASSAFDTYLALLDPTPNVVAQNDDFGSSTNSHIAFTLTVSGTWTIAANSLFGNETGSYTLTLRLSDGPPPPTADCSNPNTMCLNDGRFAVEADWEKSDGSTGDGHPVPLTADTGFFWFFGDTNVEMVVKVLNGCGLNGHYWVFAGGLTNVAVVLRVTDTQTGATVTYRNDQGVAFLPIQHTGAFGCS